MWLNKEKIIKIWNCIAFFLYKICKKPLNWIYIFVFPIILLVSVSLIFYFGNSVENYQVYDYMGASLGLPIALFTISILPYNMALDRLHKRLKIFHVFGINKKDYLFSSILSVLIIYLIVLLVLMFVISFVFHTDLKFELFLSIILVCAFNFFVAGFIGTFISTLPKTDKSIHIITSIIFMIIFLLANDYVYLSSFQETFTKSDSLKDTISKIIHFISPINAANYFTKSIIFMDIRSHSPFIWKFDWLGLVIPLLEGILFYFLTIKKFKWK